MHLEVLTNMAPNNHVQIRQAQELENAFPILSTQFFGTPSFRKPSPTTAIPLTTTFTPVPSCTENRLSQLPPPGYMIWANEPVPAANHTSSACYPEEFLRAYQSVSINAVGSSIVPAMDPLWCPMNYCTVLAAENSYVACCPFGYTLHPPDTTIDSRRPAYGGTCYSDFTVGSTYTVTAYNASGETNIMPWVASTSGAQAYAHPIDGFAACSPTLGCPVPAEPSSTDSSSTYIYENPDHPSRTTIVCVSLGAVGALAVLVATVWGLLRYFYKRRKSSTRAVKIYHIGHDMARVEAQDDAAMYEKEATAITEIGRSSALPSSHERQKDVQRCFEGLSELSGEPVTELNSPFPATNPDDLERTTSGTHDADSNLVISTNASDIITYDEYKGCSPSRPQS